MDSRYDMRFTGSGGQGVILASIILAEAAVIHGLHTAQSQSYGPEARGGLCQAEVIISKDEIMYPRIIDPTFLLALTQDSLDKYSQELSEDCIVLADSSLTIPENLDPSRVVCLPILKTASQKVGKAMTANVVAVGTINSLLGLFDDATLEESVKRHIPAGTEETNLKALKAGMELVPH